MNDINMNKNQISELELRIQKLQIENTAKNIEIKRLSEELYNLKKNNINISPNFPLAEEFKSKWNSLFLTSMMDTFDNISFNPILLMKVINFIIKYMYDFAQNKINNKVGSILDCLGVKNNNENIIKFFEKHKKSIFQEYYNSIFKINNEDIKNIIFDIKAKILLKKGILFSELDIININNDLEGEYIKSFILELFNLCLYMHINIPELVIKTSTDIKYKYYNKKEHNNLEGFAKEDDICLLILDAPMTKNNNYYKEIKPIIFLIEEPSKEIIDLCRKQNKDVIDIKIRKNIKSQSNIFNKEISKDDYFYKYDKHIENGLIKNIFRRKNKSSKLNNKKINQIYNEKFQKKYFDLSLSQCDNIDNSEIKYISKRNKSYKSCNNISPKTKKNFSHSELIINKSENLLINNPNNEIIFKNNENRYINNKLHKKFNKGSYLKNLEHSFNNDYSNKMKRPKLNIIIPTAKNILEKKCKQIHKKYKNNNLPNNSNNSFCHSKFNIFNQEFMNNSTSPIHNNEFENYINISKNNINTDRNEENEKIRDSFDFKLKKKYNKYILDNINMKKNYIGFNNSYSNENKLQINKKKHSGKIKLIKLEKKNNKRYSPFINLKSQLFIESNRMTHNENENITDKCFYNDENKQNNRLLFYKKCKENIIPFHLKNTNQKNIGVYKIKNNENTERYSTPMINLSKYGFIKKNGITHYNSDINNIIDKGNFSYIYRDIEENKENLNENEINMNRYTQFYDNDRERKTNLLIINYQKKKYLDSLLTLNNKIVKIKK